VAEPFALTELVERLDLGPKEHVALVGGGGKSTLLHALGRQLPGRVVLTTTTKMGSDQDGGFPVVLATKFDPAQSTPGTFVVWERIAGQKALGVSPIQCDQWMSASNAVDYVVIEADGARRRPFKAPAPFEPVVPATTTLVISVIGADALNRVIADQCHRPLRVAALAACQPYQRLTPSRAAAALLHPNSARRAVPADARLAIAITKVTEYNQPIVDELVGQALALDPQLEILSILDTH